MIRSENDKMTAFQAARAEQNAKIAERYQQLRLEGITPWRAAVLISEDESLARRVTTINPVQIKRILESLNVYER